MIENEQKTARRFLASLSCLDSLIANSKFQWLQSPGQKVITLYPFNYMRRLPLRDGITVGSSEGRDEKDENDLATKLRTYPWRFQYLEVPPDAIFQDSFSKLYNYARWLMFLKVLKRQS